MLPFVALCNVIDWLQPLIGPSASVGRWLGLPQCSRRCGGLLANQNQARKDVEDWFKTLP